MKKEIIELLEDLQDPDPCCLDHHGNCQAHGWFQIRRCPQERLEEILYKAKTDAVGILHRRYIGDDPERKKSLQEERNRAGHCNGERGKE